jgi:hypothetical protein
VLRATCRQIEVSLNRDSAKVGALPDFESLPIDLLRVLVRNGREKSVRKPWADSNRGLGLTSQSGSRSS